MNVAMHGFPGELGLLGQPLSAREREAMGFRWRVTLGPQLISARGEPLRWQQRQDHFTVLSGAA